MNLPAPPPNWIPTISTMVNVEVGGHPTDVQLASIEAALNEVSKASGDWYRVAATTTQIPQMLTVDSIPAPLEIWVGSAESSDLLRQDGGTDKGFTHWTPNGHAAIALLDTTPDSCFQALVMHELMLTRHIAEREDDPGGLLGHRVCRVDEYSALDLALIAAYRPPPMTP